MFSFACLRSEGQVMESEALAWVLSSQRLLCNGYLNFRLTVWCLCFVALWGKGFRGDFCWCILVNVINCRGKPYLDSFGCVALWFVFWATCCAWEQIPYTLSVTMPTIRIHLTTLLCSSRICDSCVTVDWVVANPYDVVSSRNVNQRFFLQVLKFLMDRNGTTALHGQVTIGTLILQVYMLILLLADEEDLSLFLIGCQSVWLREFSNWFELVM